MDLEFLFLTRHLVIIAEYWFLTYDLDRQLLDIVHPAARILTDIARSQDAEVGDGTTSVVVLAGEILKEVRDLVEQGVSSQTIIKGLRRAGAMAVNKVKEIAVDMIESAENEDKKIETLRRLAGTAMNSKLIKRNSDFFTKSENAPRTPMAFRSWWLTIV
jgi:T-complex protein 1 subunit eta